MNCYDYYSFLYQKKTVIEKQLGNSHLMKLRRFVFNAVNVGKETFLTLATPLCFF